MTPLMIGVGIIGVIGLISVNNLINNFDEAKETKKYIKTGEEIKYISKKSEILRHNNKYNTINGNMDIVKYGKMSDILMSSNKKEIEIIALNKLNNTILNYMNAGHSADDFKIDYSNDAEVEELWNKLKQDNFKYTKLNKEEFNIAINTKYNFYKINKYNVDISEMNQNIDDNKKIKIGKLNQKIINDTNLPIYNEQDNLVENIKISKSFLNNDRIGNQNIFKRNKQIVIISNKINNILNEKNNGYNEYMEAFRLNIKLSRLDSIYSKKLNKILNHKMLNSKNIRTQQKVILSKLNEKNIELNKNEINREISNNLIIAYVDKNNQDYNIQDNINKNSVKNIVKEKHKVEEDKLIEKNEDYALYMEQLNLKETEWKEEIASKTKTDNILMDIVIIENQEIDQTDQDEQSLEVKEMITDFNMGNSEIKVVESSTEKEDSTSGVTNSNYITKIVNIKKY